MSVTPLLKDEASNNSSVATPSDAAIVDLSLETIPLFSDLPDAVLSKLENSSDKRRYSAGQTVYSMGQYDCSEFFVILSGVLRVSVLDGETGAMQIESLGPSTIFGLEAALSERPADEFQRLGVNADNDVELLAIDAEAFRELASSRPTLMRNIATFFAAELSAMRFKTMPTEAAPEQRVYAALLEHVKRDGIANSWRIEKMPKHRELADQSGVDEVDAANAVARLIQDGIAQRDYPGLVIRDYEKLKQLAK